MPIYIGPILFASCLALLHHARFLRADRMLVAMVVLATALISGLRFEVGQDWPAYEQFFQDIDVSVGPIDSFALHTTLPSFEFGYHELNYAVKVLGGNYHAVLLLAALFFSFALYKLVAEVRANGFYVLSMYFSYSYLVLQFAQVRQALAIGIILLACLHFARTRNKAQSLALASASVLFQFSAAMYVAMFALSVQWSERWNIKAGLLLLLLISMPIFLFRDYIDFYSLLTTVAVAEFAQDKIAIYEQFQEQQGSGVWLVSSYLFITAVYLARYVNAVAPEHRFLVRFAISCILLTILFVAVFPNSYVMFSRAYVMASVLQALGVAMILEKNRGTVHWSMLVGSLLFALIYGFRLLNFYSDEYLPYKTFLFG